MAQEEGSFVSPGRPLHPHTWELEYNLCPGSWSEYPARPRECFLDCPNSYASGAGPTKSIRGREGFAQSDSTAVSPLSLP